jgi:hypothetical protein
MLVFVILGYALLSIYEFFPLYKENKQKEFYVNLVLGIISFTMAILISLRINIPSPAEAIKIVINYILKAFAM